MVEMTREERAAEVYNRLSEMYPDRTHTWLNAETPLEILVAVILSAQCTDKRVNKVTEHLFEKYETVEDYVDVPHEELAKDIKSTGYYNNKAKWIQGACKKIIEDFNGTVPDTMEDLVTLPGVGRKTANVVLYEAYGNISGVVVDTHMKRVAYRIGLTDEKKNRDKIEEDLMELLPREKWPLFSLRVIQHGRATCKAPTPTCSECPLLDVCPQNGVENPG